MWLGLFACWAFLEDKQTRGTQRQKFSNQHVNTSLGHCQSVCCAVRQRSATPFDTVTHMLLLAWAQG